MSSSSSSKDGMHSQFKRFLVSNLCHSIGKDKDGKDIKLYEAYKQYSELRWNKSRTLLDDPARACKVNTMPSQFLIFMLETEKEDVPWFMVSRQCGLSDANLKRCSNNFKQRFMYVSLPNSQRVDLGILEYLIQINKYQLNLRLPQSSPIVTIHTARLMRQLYILHQKHPELVPYSIDNDTEQFKKILWSWFKKNYTVHGDGIGYPRRQLLEEANDFITRTFGAVKLMYCHDSSWRDLLKKIGIDDTAQKGSYLRLKVWKKALDGTYMPNERKSSGPGGEFTYKKRKAHRLKNRAETKKEKDTERKQVENGKRKKRMEL